MASYVNEINEWREIQRILRRTPPLNKPRIMLQIGASDGRLARRMAERGWLAYAFDPNPKYSKIGRMDDVDGRFHFFNRAISPNEGDLAEFYVSAEHPGTSSLRKNKPDQRRIEVLATTLRQFYAEWNVAAIDYFMIDAETMDLEIVRTHDWSIPISALLMECTPSSVIEIQNNLMDQIPDYRHVVFDWRKPKRAPGITGRCVRMCTAEEFAKTGPVEGGVFGNILFYRHSFLGRLKALLARG